jgi:hypothetical protein
MPDFNPLDLLNPLAIGGGILGALFDSGGGDFDPEIRNLILQRARQGIDPKLLAAMKRKAVGSVGNEFAALSSQAQSRLRRQNAPVAIQEQTLEKLATRRAGARTDALTGIDALNEQVKGGALGQLGQFAVEAPYGQSYGDLIGAGLGGLQQQLAQDEYFKQLDMILNKG